jgi:hypothetical protein
MAMRALVLLLLVAAVVVPAAGANAPIRQTFTLSDVTFPDAYLSDACGTTVLDTVSVTITVAVFVDTNGTAVAEVDTVTRGTITYSAPATDNSVSSVMNGVSHATYPEGIAVGASAPTTITGVNTASLTGVAPPGDGRVVANAVVVALDPSGVPFTAFGTDDIVSMNGTFGKTTDEICDALT